MDEQLKALLVELHGRIQAVEETTGQIVQLLEGSDPPIFFVPVFSEDTQPLDLDAVHGQVNG